MASNFKFLRPFPWGTLTAASSTTYPDYVNLTNQQAATLFWNSKSLQVTLAGSTTNLAAETYDLAGSWSYPSEEAPYGGTALQLNTAMSKVVSGSNSEREPIERILLTGANASPTFSYNLVAYSRTGSFPAPTIFLSFGLTGAWNSYQLIYEFGFQQTGNGSGYVVAASENRYDVLNSGAILDGTGSVSFFGFSLPYKFGHTEGVNYASHVDASVTFSSANHTYS